MIQLILMQITKNLTLPAFFKFRSEVVMMNHLTASGAHSVLAVPLVELERSPELSRHLLKMVVQSVLGQVNGLVMPETPVLVVPQRRERNVNFHLLIKM